MKIVHIILSGPFTEGMTYQENLLPIQNAIDGHSVVIIASCLSWHKTLMVKLPECDKIISNGIRLIRIDYNKIINNFITEKVRKSSKLLPIIEKISPDIIFLHDSQVFEIINIARYKNKNKEVRFIVDFHSDYYNSGKNIFSYIILHKVFYKYLLMRAKKSIDKMYCITRASKNFLEEVYSFKSSKTEIYPLGGIFNKNIETERFAKRRKYNFSDSEIIFLHSGKINKNKKTKELLEIFNKIEYNDFKLLIIGDIEKDYNNVIMPLIEKNSRVQYLGWKNSEELMEYLSISDVYIQPGTPSATLQNAICAGNAVIVAQKDIYEDIVKENGWIINNVSEIKTILENIKNDRLKLERMKSESLRIGKTILDYKVLADRMYNI